jgi:glycosyltransferase involved in cell wall biosynthesis
MRVLIYPRGDNPYQELLYQQLRQNPGDKFTYIDSTRLNIVFFPLILGARRAQGYEILHLHWLAFQTNILTVYGKQLSFVLTLWSVTWAKLLRYKVVWTVHNVLPHESVTSNDTTVARYVAKIADAKIVHSSSALKQMRDYGISVENTNIIPAGNYIGVYLDSITPVQARHQLHVNKGDFLILFFGLIRSYKGVDDLVDIFTQINALNVRLIIAGKCLDETLNHKILEAQNNSNIDYYEGFIENSDVATYFKACDIVCLPFKAVTTSGSALLALSFGKPLIAPRTGALLDVPEDIGYLYDPTTPDALRKSIAKAIKEKAKLREKGDAALAYAKNLSWDSLAETTYKVYENVLNRSATNTR